MSHLSSPPPSSNPPPSPPHLPGLPTGRRGDPPPPHRPFRKSHWQEDEETCRLEKCKMEDDDESAGWCDNGEDRFVKRSGGLLMGCRLIQSGVVEEGFNGFVKFWSTPSYIDLERWDAGENEL
ncbi:hypothetical protein LINPERHAP1_LOCUS21982 [Linum perenne]